MMNNKFKKSQILMLSLLAALLFITPLLSSSLRPTYLYFIINLLIVALGAEADLLSVFFSKPPLEDKKPAVTVASNSGVLATTPEESSNNNNNSEGKEKKGRVFEKSASEKIPRGVKVERVKKCPSTPSLFFIGNGETDHPAEEQVGYEKFYEEEEEEVGGGLSGQELFNKAENFIGNFYKQLKMQREESWKRIHGFYQKAF